MMMVISATHDGCPSVCMLCCAAAAVRCRHSRILNGTVQMGPLSANCPCHSHAQMPFKPIKKHKLHICLSIYVNMSSDKQTHTSKKSRKESWPFLPSISSLASPTPHNRTSRLCLYECQAKYSSFYFSSEPARPKISQ